MAKSAILVLVVLFARLAGAQTVMRLPKKVPGADKPVCAAGAICFSGQISAGKEFRKPLTPDLDFALTRGWWIAIYPKQPEGECQEFASVVNAPYRQHRQIYIDTSYGWTAEDETETSPREFRFVTNCADYQTESQRLNIVMWPYTATPETAAEAQTKLGTSPLGTGRLWITDSRISHAGDTADEKQGKIEWMKFTVEIKLPKALP